MASEDALGILHPGITVQAGPFTARIGDMHRFGWEFHAKREAMWDDAITILGRNLRYGGQVFYSRVPGYYADMIMRERATTSRLVYQFPHDMIIEAHSFREIEMPHATLHPLEVGHVFPNMTRGDCEIMLYDSNTRAEKEPETIIVMPEDEGQLLEQLLRVQRPKQQELLAAEREAGNLRELQTRAKILTFDRSA